MNLRELVGTSLLSTHLETKEERESAIDRVGALGRATKLGSALWRWKVAGDPGAAPTALSALLRKAQRRTKVYRHNKDFKLLTKVCKMVLAEWYFPNCRECGGRREFVDEKLRVVCAVCNGTGLHRYDDRERFLTLGIPQSELWEKRIAEVWLCLAGEDHGTQVVVRYQLER